MELPDIIKQLLHAQAAFDSKAYSKCFANTAIVFDENETHKGQMEIMKWNEKTNLKYQPPLEPIAWSTIEKLNTLSPKVTGNFPGSPIVLKYQFKLNNGCIESLKITS